MNWLREGRHYGFPWRMGGNTTPQQFAPYDPHHDPLLSPFAWGGGNLYVTFSDDPAYPSPPSGVTFTEPIPSSGPDADRLRDTVSGSVEDASTLGATISTFTPHRSPDGLVFDRDSVLGGDLKGGGFVVCLAPGALLTALHDTSQDLLHVALTKSGDQYAARVTKLVSGFNQPLGIELVGNKLFVLETALYGTNPSPKLWEITLPKGSATSVTGQPDLRGSLTLLQNYPNPFNPATTIRFSVPGEGRVQLAIYDLLGRRVRTLLDGNLSGGVHAIRWDGRDERGIAVGSGTYFYRLSAGSGLVQTRRLTLLK
jgi:hypothetical protein